MEKTAKGNAFLYFFLSLFLCPLWRFICPWSSAHTTEWIRVRGKPRREGRTHSWHLSLLEMLVAPENEEGKPCGHLPLPTGTFPPPLLPPGRHSRLVNHSTCIGKRYLRDRKIAASLPKPQSTVRWISPKAPKPFPFYYHVAPHFNTY